MPHPAYTEIDLATWSRRAAYKLFKTYEDPYFNLTAPVDVTALLAHCKATGGSFFLHSLYYAMQAANAVPAFRLRIQGEAVFQYHQIYAGATILNDDGTFGFCYFDYTDDLPKFLADGGRAIAAQKAGKGFNPRDEAHDLIHCSVIPWISFTSFKHARRFGTKDSIPKIVFGKYYREGDRYKIPLSVEVHHALMDGFHVGEYYNRFQAMVEDH